MEHFDQFNFSCYFEKHMRVENTIAFRYRIVDSDEIF